KVLHGELLEQESEVLEEEDPAPKGELLELYRHFTLREVNRSIYQVLTQNRQSVDRYVGSVFSTYPMFDLPTRSVYVPIAMIETSRPFQQEYFLVQVPRLTIRLISQLLRSIHEKSYSFGEMEWDYATSNSFLSVQSCLDAEYT